MMTHLIRIFFTISLFILISSQILICQTEDPRNTLWLRGPSQTSLGWKLTPSWMTQDYNYDFLNIISIQGLPVTAYDIDLGVFGAAAKLDSLLSLNNYDDILVLGHDVGGLVARKLSNDNTNVSAIVLNGTPNHGSGMINAMLNFNNFDSELQRLINRANNLRQDNNCQDCNFIGEFEGWIEGVNNHQIFTELLPNSEAVNHLSQNPPQVPHVIFWGETEDDFSLSSILDVLNNTFMPYNSDLSECIETRIALRLEEIDIRDEINRINMQYGMIADILRIGGGILNNATDTSGNNFGDFLTSFGEIIEARRDYIIADIERVAEMDRSIGDLLRCQLANQVLASGYEIALVSNETQFELESVEVLDPSACFDYCAQVNITNMLTDFDMCYQNCIDSPNAPTQTVTYQLLPPHDGLLTKNEQMLDGAEKVYHLPNTNHFQESIHQNSLLLEHLDDLFDGNAGMAFYVPKN